MFLSCIEALLPVVSSIPPHMLLPDPDVPQTMMRVGSQQPMSDMMPLTECTADEYRLVKREPTPPPCRTARFSGWHGC